MTTISKMALNLPEGYGYVIFTACGSIFVNMWMAVQVSHARKNLDVPYPMMYSVTSKEFNCVQRAHQNTLENYPQFLMLLLIGGLRYPAMSAGAGVVYLLGRIVYAKGYYTGDPAKRKWGNFMHVAEMVLFANTISFACHQLNLYPRFASFLTAWTSGPTLEN